MYTDTHCHLNFQNYQTDLNEVLSRAALNQVEKIMIPGFTLESSQAAVRIANQNSGCFAAVGIHPNDAQEWNPQTEQNLIDLLKQPKVLAVGEIGLDYYRDHAPHDLQQTAFKAQLSLAKEFNKPIIIHIRESVEDTLEMLFAWQQTLSKDHHPLAEHPGILHSFPGRIEEAHRAFEHGFFIGIGGPVTFKNAREKHRLVEQIPLEYVVLETDAPFLTPHPHRGTRNEPAYIPLVAEKIAELKQQPISLIADVTNRNAKTVFNW